MCYFVHDTIHSSEYVGSQLIETTLVVITYRLPVIQVTLINLCNAICIYEGVDLKNKTNSRRRIEKVTTSELTLRKNTQVENLGTH